jgi:hypothetical protein
MLMSSRPKMLLREHFDRVLKIFGQIDPQHLIINFSISDLLLSITTGFLLTNNKLS